MTNFKNSLGTSTTAKLGQLGWLADLVSGFICNTGVTVDQKQPLEVFYKKAVLKNFAIFTGNT